MADRPTARHAPGPTRERGRATDHPNPVRVVLPLCGTQTPGKGGRQALVGSYRHAFSAQGELAEKCELARTFTGFPGSGISARDVRLIAQVLRLARRSAWRPRRH